MSLSPPLRKPTSSSHARSGLARTIFATEPSLSLAAAAPQAT